VTCAAESLLAELAARGVEVQADGETLRLRPAAALSADLLAEVRERKRELLEVVALEPEILAALAAEPLSGRELSLRLGRPPDARLYPALVHLLDRGVIATDPRSCLYRLAK
jgi:hypothetical protein